MHTATKTQWKATGGKTSVGSDVLRRFPMQESANSLYSEKNAVTASSEDYSFRKASLLDVPFIFYLIEDGSLTGAFPPIYATLKGSPTLFLMLVRDMLCPRRFIGNGICETQTLIFTQGDEDIGFMQIGRTDDGQPHVIKCCAIAHQYRNQHHGSQMIRMYLENLRTSAETVVYCTKMNKTMPHVLKKFGFHKEHADSGYDCYRLKAH